MPRGLTLAQKTAAAARIKRPAYFVKLDLASGSVRAWNGLGDVTLLGGTWKGVGEFGVIDGVEHDRTLRASQMSIGLVGLPGSTLTGGILAATRLESYKLRPLSLYLGFCNVDTDVPLGDPTPIWVGFADVMTFQIGKSVSVSLTGEHLSSHLRRANGLRMTTESHNGRLGFTDPNKDLFFEAADRLMGKPKPAYK